MPSRFTWDDPFFFDDQLSSDERAVRDAAAAYCQERLQTRVAELDYECHEAPFTYWSKVGKRR